VPVNFVGNMTFFLFFFIGILKEKLSILLLDPNYYNQNLAKLFEVKYKKSVVQEMSHSRHCVPEDVASGLANLPIKYVWLDQNQTDIETTQTLPTGEKLNGAKSYEMMLPYFTTTKKYDATSIFLLGESQLKKLYKRAEEIAMKITNRTSLEMAVDELKIDLNHPRHFFNVTPIPDHENEALGASLCRNMKMAKRNCPVRYKAMQEWYNFVRMTISRIEPMLLRMFYHVGKKVTTPNCPVALTADFNPSTASHSYSDSVDLCSSKPCLYKLPFFLEMPGPKYEVYSVVGHETRPGHHVQVNLLFRGTPFLRI